VIVDRSGTIRYANGACKALVERTRPEGRNIFEILDLDASFLRSVLRRLRDTEVWRGVTSVEIQGKPCELELSVGAVKVGEWGRAHGFSVVARPVTVQRESRALQSSSGARDVFATLARVAGAIAHDFNNHIAVVLNYSFILLRELSSEGPERAQREQREQRGQRGQRGHMEELQQAAWRAAGTARNLLRLTGQRGPEPTALDVNDVIRDARVTLAMIAGSHTELEQRWSQTPCITKARRSELEWLLIELTQRLRSRLGELRYVRIAALSLAHGCVLSASNGQPRIRIQLDGFAARAALRDAIGLRAGPSTLDAAESEPKLSAQLGCELALHSLPDEGLRYVIDLPGF
jgi:hypothetical protein